MILLPYLYGTESDQEHTEHDEKGDDAAIAPRILASSPLQRKEKAYNHRQEDQGTVKIELFQLCLPPNCERLCVPGRIVIDDDEQ